MSVGRSVCSRQMIDNNIINNNNSNNNDDDFGYGKNVGRIIASNGEFEIDTQVVVVGSGGCGLAAAIAAGKAGAEVVLLEKDITPSSNTERSGGMIPAAATRYQIEAGVVDSEDDFFSDIVHKNNNTSDVATTRHLVRTSKRMVEWLVEDVKINLKLVTDFKYPGHTRFRMHAPPSRTGAQLINELRSAAESMKNVTIMTGSPVKALIAEKKGNDGSGGGSDEFVGSKPVGVLVQQENGEDLRIKCEKLILACNGFGGNKTMIQKYCPEIESALYFGGAGNTGEGIVWGLRLGGNAKFMNAFQGHSTVAVPHSILITYATVMEGGVQVNKKGKRFADETSGYSEHALEVLKQEPDGIVWTLYDSRIHALCMGFDDYKTAYETGAIKHGEDWSQLGEKFGIDTFHLRETMSRYNDAARSKSGQADEFGRKDCRDLLPPFYGVKTTGALFHTQGGLQVDENARVVAAAGGVIPNLYAGGGVAAGISGNGPGGYLSGNGLLTALSYGMLAGTHAAASLPPSN